VVAGHDVRTDPVAVKKQIGYLAESSPAYQEMTVLEFLDFVAECRELGDREQRAKRIDEVVELCHLTTVRNQPIETLSKGFRQRVGFAQAVIHDPAILILDEPTDGLDPNQKHEVRKIISGMAENKVVILSTHILEEVDALCTRIIIIANGKVAIRAAHGDRLDEVFRKLTANA
jgi:ABC-2 type transport system ATP-binding protein